MNTDDEIEAAYDRGREAGVDSCEPQIEDLRAEIQTLQSRLDSFRWRVLDHDDEKSFPEPNEHVLLASQFPAGVFTSEAWLVDWRRGLWHLEATDGSNDQREVWGSDAKAWMPLPEFVVERREPK